MSWVFIAAPSLNPMTAFFETFNLGSMLRKCPLPYNFPSYASAFNPISIFNSIEDVFNKKMYTEKDIDFNKEIFFSYNHHSSYSSLNKEEVIKKTNNSISDNYDYLLNSKVLFLTFGTSWIYRNKTSKKVVANCYKMPSNLFTKELLKVEDIIINFENIIEKIKIINPNIQIISTISPVRHWKDGAIENQVSKSTLFLALNEVNKKHPNCHYFPSYEIMLDDLRDYRFYEKDMLHPSPIAIDYIWKKLELSLLNKNTIDLNKKIVQLNSAINHRAFNPNSEETKRFKTSTLKKVIALEKEYNLNFELEKSNFIN